MEGSIQCPEMLLDQDISGLHQYHIKGEKADLSYVSQNLCRMLGYSKEELAKRGDDGYESCVHKEDRTGYHEFLRKLSREEGRASFIYRLTKKDGGVLFIADTAVSRRREDGTVLVTSTLSDLTKDWKEFLLFQETAPCGVLRCSCERQPKITYLNENMKKLLGYPEGETQDFSLVGDSLFLIVPVEERKRLMGHLERVMESGGPVAGELTVLRGDGSKASLFGWITKTVDSQGREAFQSVCMDVTKQRRARKEEDQKRYMKALGEVYDKIFSYDLAARTVTCLMSHQSPRFQWLERLPMQMEEATENWIRDNVSSQDQAEVQNFFRQIFSRGAAVFEEKPPQITYHAQNSQGRLCRYTGIFLSQEEQVGLFCCRKVPGQEEADPKTRRLSERAGTMEELLLRFTDGIAAFELRDQ